MFHTTTFPQAELRNNLRATETDIQCQFLSEAAISLLGGFLGVLAGIGTSALMQDLLQWEIKLTPQLLVFSGFVAAPVGNLFRLLSFAQSVRAKPD